MTVEKLHQDPRARFAARVRINWNQGYEAARDAHAAIDPFSTPLPERIDAVRMMLRLAEFTGDEDLSRGIVNAAAALLDGPEGAVKLRDYLRSVGESEPDIAMWYAFPSLTLTDDE